MATQWLNKQSIDLGGLRFGVYYTLAATEQGPTIRVYGDVDGEETELLRFDSFRNKPHYHAPASGPQIDIDASAVGNVLEWSLTQVREHIPEWLDKAGFGQVAERVDRDSLSKGWERIRDAAVASIPTD
jgi:hypothetical protein